MTRFFRAYPASLSSSQSGISATAEALLLRMLWVALPRFRLSCVLARLSLADSSKCGVLPSEKASETLVFGVIYLSSVLASIWARCTVATPALWRLSPPPMCIRQELSPAVQTSASVSRTCRSLSPSIAIEVSAFLIANVPPKPQHSLASGSSTKSMPRTALRSSKGASPTFNILKEWQGGGEGDRGGEEGA